MRRLLAVLLILSCTFALPTCITDPLHVMNITATNSTPILQTMTVDISTDQSVGTHCIVRVYDENTAIENYYTQNEARTSETPLNGIDSLLNRINNDLIVSLAGTAHQDIYLAPWKYREEYPYVLYVECGTSCEYGTFYADSPRFILGERLTENFIMSLIKNPLYTVLSIITLGLILQFLFFLWYKIVGR